MSELQIVKLVPGGEGLGFLDGKAVFVPMVLPGERVEVRTVERRRDFDRAALVKVVEGSAHRVSPPCRLAGICGGCDWLHMSYPEQLAQKRAIALEALRRTGRIERETVDIEGAPPLASRNRAQVHRDADGRHGFMSARTNRVVPVETCPVSVHPINGVFRGAARTPSTLDRFTLFSNGTWLAVEGIDDERDLSVTVCGREILFSVGCFFQSNLAALEKLLPWALEGLAGDTAADLYCGVGLFGAFLADRFARVVAVESSSTSLAYARRNIRGERHEFFPMSVEQWIASGAARTPFDAILLDPPRPGLSAPVREWLIGHPPRRLVYVSCDPVTLARDLGELLAGRFALEDLRLFDFSPQTSRIEAAARLGATT